MVCFLLGATSAKLVGQKAKGTPKFRVKLTKLQGIAATDAMGTISVEMFNVFRSQAASLSSGQFFYAFLWLWGLHRHFGKLFNSSSMMFCSSAVKHVTLKLERFVLWHLCVNLLHDGYALRRDCTYAPVIHSLLAWEGFTPSTVLTYEFGWGAIFLAVYASSM